MSKSTPRLLLCNPVKFILLITFSAYSYFLKAQVIYNAYASVSAISGKNFTVTNVDETNHTFAVNENIIIMQMQDDVIGTNTTNVSAFGVISPTTGIASAGLWEVANISAVTRSGGILTALTVVSNLTNTYNINSHAAVQLITFRNLSSAAFTSSANITGKTWNGTTGTGGVIALEVGTVFTLGHSISADAIGFAGGVKNPTQFASTSCDPTFVTAIGNKWAGKGEGIYKNTDVNLAGARGKMINGGGGGTDENSGGGGGSNYAAGGDGGPGYNGTSTGCTPGVGGQGGFALTSFISGNRVFMGGGGGGGHENNNVGTIGANGGGIILLKTGTLTTTGSCAASISANGGTSANAGNDAAGGGGAGGSIIMQVNTFSIASSCPLSLSSNGGSGGSINYSQAHGAGGGAGQGAVLYSIAQPTTNMTTSTNNGTGGCNDNNVPCTSTAGTPTLAAGAGIMDHISSPLPVELSAFTGIKTGQASLLQWTTLTERNNNYFEIERASNGTDFESIGKVSAQTTSGNSNSILKYTYYDNYPLWGINYYRLKQVNTNKTFQYYAIVSVNQNQLINQGNFVIYPNPSNGDIYMDIKNLDTKNLKIELALMDLSGRQVNNKSISNLQEISQIQLFQGLQKGYYILNVKTDYQSFNIKLVVN